MRAGADPHHVVPQPRLVVARAQRVNLDHAAGVGDEVRHVDDLARGKQRGAARIGQSVSLAAPTIILQRSCRAVAGVTTLAIEHGANTSHGVLIAPSAGTVVPPTSAATAAARFASMSETTISSSVGREVAGKCGADVTGALDQDASAVDARRGDRRARPRLGPRQRRRAPSRARGPRRSQETSAPASPIACRSSIVVPMSTPGR